MKLNCTKAVTMACWFTVRNGAWAGRVERRMHQKLLEIFKGVESADKRTLEFTAQEVELADEVWEYFLDMVNARFEGKEPAKTPADLAAPFGELLDLIDSLKPKEKPKE